MVELLKDLVAADREGDWEVHLLIVQNILLIFRELTSSFLQYESFYLENMRCLPEEGPEIYTKLTRSQEIYTS